ncbi:MAG: sigma-70 family RNA polymerase sigma factor [Bacteroidota bacterium]
MDTPQIVDSFFRTEYGKVVSHLSSRFGSKNIELAEDAVQETLIKAVQTWPHQEIPENPTGWIIRVAANKMIDHLRREERMTQESVPEKVEPANDFVSPEVINDDMVRMIFACCHPELSLEYQLIITLKILGGLSIREIAVALLKKEETIAKAYTRAKKKFKKEEINLSLPPAHEIAKRLDMVLKVIYLLFNEGYKATEGTQLIREDLCEEAIRLNKILLDSEICDTPAANGLIAMMLFQAARFPARVNQSGELIPLEYQDRSVWDTELINLGLKFLKKATNGTETNEYIIQASINAIHCQSESLEKTDWVAILQLYDLQLKIESNPIVALNRIVPLLKAKGAISAWNAIEKLESTLFFEEYYLFYAIKATVLEEMGDHEGRIDCLKTALSLVKNSKEKAFLERQLAASR